MATKPPTTDAKKSADPKDFTVAAGRTVTADRDYGPGETVSLDPDEGAKLQRLGFLVADKDVVIDEGAGPPVVAGAEIKES